MTFNFTSISTVIFGLVAAVAGILAIPERKARPPLLTIFGISLSLAVVMGVYGAIGKASSGSNTAGQSPGASNSSPIGNTTPSDNPAAISSAGTSATPADFAQVPLNVTSGMQATAYFGQLSSVVGSLQGEVSFNLNQVYSIDPQRCSLTVVFTHVPGNTGAVYAQGLGSGWGAAESAPSLTVADPGRSLHQQIVTPPGTAVPGMTWSASASISAGTVQVSAESYNLALQSVTGSTMTWSISGNEVTCDR